MSKIDKIPFGKKISLRKHKVDLKRKMSITDSQFNAFYNAYEQNSKDYESVRINDALNISPDGNSTRFWTFSSPQKPLYQFLQKKSNSFYWKSLINNEAGEAYGDFTIKKTFQKKRNSVKSNTAKSISVSSNNLSSIVNSLKELENEI